MTAWGIEPIDLPLTGGCSTTELKACGGTKTRSRSYLAASWHRLRRAANGVRNMSPPTNKRHFLTGLSRNRCSDAPLKRACGGFQCSRRYGAYRESNPDLFLTMETFYRLN